MVDKCTVCASEAIVSPRPNDLLQDVVCPTCGKYRSGLHFGFDAPKHILSGVIREASDDGRDITVTSENVDQLIQSASVPKELLEQTERILLHVARKSESANEYTTFLTTDYPIAFAKHNKEFDYFLVTSHRVV